MTDDWLGLIRLGFLVGLGWHVAAWLVDLLRSVLKR